MTYVAVTATQIFSCFTSPVTFQQSFQYQSLTQPAFVPTPPAVTAVCNVTNSSQVTFNSYLIYQSRTQPVFTPVVETVTVDKWFQELEIPTPPKCGLLASQQQAAIGPVLNPESQITQNYESRWHFAWSEPVRLKRGLLPNLQQTRAFVAPNATTEDLESRWHYPWSEPVRVKRQVPVGEQPFFTSPVAPPTEIVTIDKWLYQWSEPVRQKIGLKTHLQQAFIAPVLDPNTQISQDFESRWHFPWAEPVRFKQFPTAEQLAFIRDPVTPEIVTVDKWTYSWSEPVRFRSFPTSEQQPYAAPVYTPEFITTDKWIYPWTEPVRQKIGLKAGLQQAAIGPVLDDETQIIDTFESRWHFPWSEPVRIKRQVPAGEQSFLIQGPVQTPEFLTVDKWIYAWSEPVRQKIGLKTHLQQAFIAPVLDDETQIIQNFESRWHYPWSEPVRVRQPLLTAQQQALIFQSAFFETVNIDKWGFAWSEPVRQKPGIKTYLQQAFIGLTLNPDTQISQNFESRWHFAWSEPVRIRRQVPAGEQQALIQGPVQTPEFITVDKWIYAWSEPVRQKIGFAARLQQAFIAPVLADEQLTGTIESRWHQAWSEPVRFRRFATAEQLFTAAPATSVFETIYADKWIYPWSEPVRQKIGLKTGLQQSFIGLTLNPETQIIQDYESRWHQPWSTPTLRKTSVASQPSFVWSTFTPAVVTITEDQWHQAWSIPVRQPIGLKTTLQQSFTAPIIPNPTLVGSFSSAVIFQRAFQYQPVTQPAFVPAPVDVSLFESTWHQPWLEPSVKEKRGLKSNLQQAFIAPVLNPETQIIQDFESRWHQSWSEPLRSKPGLSAWLQDAITPKTPIFPTGVARLSEWFAPLSEPVRLKIGLSVTLQRFFQTSQEQILPDVLVTLSATEVNTDSALFGVTAYNAVPVVSRVPTTFVSIKEIPATRKAAVSTEEVPAVDNASVSIEET